MEGAVAAGLADLAFTAMSEPLVDAMPPIPLSRRWATFIGLGVLLVSTPATGIFAAKITVYR